MSLSRAAAVLACLLLPVLAANAVSRKNIQIKVLDSETRASVDDNNGVPVNCEQLTFDAYCRSSRTAPLVNTLLVQEGDNPPSRISCRAESRLSKCVPLPKGESFEARKEKNGFVIHYVDDNGKARSQLYAYVKGEAPSGAKAAGSARESAKTGATGDSGGTAPSVPTVSTPASESPNGTPASAQDAARAPAATPGQVVEGASVPSSQRQTVKCSFTSTPAGAEVTVDGRYVGSTPSVIGLSTGAHVVVVSIAGFEQWKRDLTVEAGSELTVNAVLQKSQ